MTEMGSLDRFFADMLLKKVEMHTEEQRLSLCRLMRGAREGNLCMREDQVGSAIASLPASIVEEGKDLFPKAPIVRDAERYYLQKNWVLETSILQHTRRLRANQPPSYFDRNLYEKNLSELSVELIPTQREAILSCLDRSLLIICGGPGTGKTYTAGNLAKLLFSCLRREEKSHFRICVAAPTGKAASHLQAALLRQISPDPSLHIEVATLHKLLHLQPNRLRLFSNRRVDADLVIVDEASMIDVSLFAHLLEAIGEETILVLIGDPDQLPPVEMGSLFAEMGSLFGIRLERCMRTEEPLLQKLAQAIREGNSKEFFDLLERGSPHVLWTHDFLSPEKLYAKVEPVVSVGRPDLREALKKYNRFRILNALRQGSHGIDRLNREIFERLQGKKNRWVAPILSTINDSFSGLYNGMNGLLVGQSSKEIDAYFADFSNEEMRHFPSPPPYELAFCLSIHKAQGSEFEEVLALFPEGSEHFGREALYTAVTRAKKKLQIMGSREILEKMIASTKAQISGFVARMAREALILEKISSSKGCVE